MRYRVKALSVGGRGKKIYYSGDIVVAENFPGGNAEALVANGHLERLPDGEGLDAPIGPTRPDIDEDAPDVSTESAENNDESEAPADLNQDNVGELDIESISIQQLKKELKALGVPFSNTATKKELFDIWAGLPK